MKGREQESGNGSGASLNQLRREGKLKVRNTLKLEMTVLIGRHLGHYDLIELHVESSGRRYTRV